MREGTQERRESKEERNKKRKSQGRKECDKDSAKRRRKGNRIEAELRRRVRKKITVLPVIGMEAAAGGRSNTKEKGKVDKAS